jgi:alpha-L-fucosidase
MRRREFLQRAAAGVVALGRLRAADATASPAEASGGGGHPFQSQRPRPTVAQLAWQRDELAMFLHFGVNTFTDREWGDGREDPAIFAPAALDPYEWAKTARAAGFRALILTAKHHDGFCLWPTKTTTHSVARSPWRNGRGDVVREFVDACRAEGLGAGLYLSPWDRNHPAYGDSPRYNDVYAEQLTELLTRYGTLNEVWFDGANGEGANGKRQIYDWPRTFGLVRKLQPHAVVFSDAGPDVRWCGNENGTAGEPNWSSVNPARVTVPGATGPDVVPALQRGDPDGSVWRPAEADTSIRPGWFHHPAEDSRAKTAERLFDIYCRSVGRNSKLLLNVPPTRDGRLHPTDVARLTAFRDLRQAAFGDDLVRNARVIWERTGTNTATAEVVWDQAHAIGAVRLEEDIAHGQAVARYAVQGAADGEWREISRGTTIGHAKIDRLATPVTVRRVRVVIEDALAPAEPVRLKIYPAR